MGSERLCRWAGTQGGATWGATCLRFSDQAVCLLEWGACMDGILCSGQGAREVPRRHQACRPQATSAHADREGGSAGGRKGILCGPRATWACLPAGLTVGILCCCWPGCWLRGTGSPQAVPCTAPFWPTAEGCCDFEPSPPAKACFCMARPVRGIHCWVHSIPDSSTSGCMFSHLLV